MWTIRIFNTFLWKNWKCINVISAILQLILLIGILGVYLNQTDNMKILPETRYEEKNEQLLSSLFTGEEDDFIFYAPSNSFIDDLMEKVRLDLYVLADRLVPFATAEEMFLELEGKTGTRSFGIFFQEFPSSENKSASKHLKYGISSPAISISTEHKYLNDYETVGIKEYDDYIGSGLFLLQRNIDKIFMNEVTGKNTIYETEILPVPSISVEVADSGRIKSFGLLFILLLNILLLSMVLVPLVEEKQDGIKEFLVLATPYNYLNGITFAFIRFWIFLFFGGTSLAAAYMWNAIGEISLIYTSSLFILTIFSQLCFTFLISVIFNSVFFAKVGGLLLLLVPVGIFALEIKSCWYFSMFFSSNTFLEGMSIFQKFTNKHHLFVTSSLDHYITPTSFQLLSVYATLIMQAALYCFFYWYLSHVLPGKGGIAKPLDFFLHASYYQTSTPSFIEPSEQSLQPEVAVKIRKLTKDVNISMFDKIKCGLGKSKRIVDNLSMDIENNKITVLLGHNGAGKTTTINMIVGCINKTYGNIIVSNEKDVSVYRHLIGYCPQHNIFLPYLTCEEHLNFFAALRGLDDDEAEARSNYILKQLKLSDKAKEKGRNLSGGMKRRLSLGIAISGNTKVVILDEPSSGLDPESRRDLWNSLLELRKTQAVLVTTHHMDEAEILGDSVAILSNGKLKLYGETLELKRNHGSGYILKLLTEENFQQEEIMNIIKEIIPTATIKTFVQPTLCVTLPYKYQSQYQFVLNRLENCQNLGISSISISDTSLEEVFLNSESVDQCDTIKYREIKSQDVNTTTNPARDPKILANQTFAIFYKKAVFVRRQWIYTAFMCSLPIIMTVLALWAVGFQRVNSEMTALPLNLNYIRDAKIYANIPPEFSNFKDYLKSEVQGKAQIIFLHGAKSIDQEMLALQQNDLHNFHHTVIGALEMKITSDDSPSIIKIYYSSNILHSSVIMLNLVDNVILKDMSSDEKASIEASQIPTKRVADISPTRLEYYNVLVPIGWIVYMLYYISLPFMEQKNEFKNLQPVPKLAYWLSFTFFDAVLHTIICICALVLQTLLPIREVFNTSELIWLTATYMFYGISYLPILYIMANTFKSLSGLIALYIFIVVVSCIAPLITSTNHQAMDKFSEIIMMMSVIPDFSLNHQMRIIGENYFINRRNDLVQEEFGLHVPLGVNFTGKQVKPLDNTTFFFYAILVLIVSEIFLIFIWEDINFRRAIESVFSFGCFRRAKTKPSCELDGDVSLEQDIVAEEIKNIGKDNKHKKDDSSPLLVNCVHKKYKNIHAVRGLTFRVKRGECFGLLGINGAGKTSTFQMITGNEKITKGDVYIEHVNVHQYKNWYKFLFGYCPQVDALNGFMSSYEILKYMALLRGIPHKDVDNEVKYWLRQLNLERYKDDPIVHYSGGTKRKLNVALAMIGNPQVLFLDEPTTGVDPVSRRFMWECIQKFQKSEKTIVLTSHSMDECEYLCNRLAIMTDGQFQCVGYIPMLKAKFGSGFTIKFRIKDNCSEGDCHQFNNYVLSKFKCSLIEKHASVLTYFVTDKDVIWSKVFILLEEIKLNSLVLCEYSINETTLEDIFLKFRGKLEEVLIC